MVTLLPNKGITVHLLQGPLQVNTELRPRDNMERPRAPTAATSKHPQARLHRPVLATCPDKRHL